MTERAESFAHRWQTLRDTRGPFCLNLDPTPELLEAWGLAQGSDGLEGFCMRTLEAAGERVSVIKPQSAYFERFGASGARVLEDTIRAIQASGALVLLDVKRGDIGSTNRGYAEGLLGPGSSLRADALTVHAYLGFAALGPLLDRAVERGCAIFPVVRSSNPEGRAVQHARLESGLTVAESLAEEITAYNRKHTPEGVGAIGAVVGATCEDAPGIVERLPTSLILTPGVGAQGATVEDLVVRFAAARSRVIACVGRSVLAAGPDSDALRDAIHQQADAVHRSLG